MPRLLGSAFVSLDFIPNTAGLRALVDAALKKTLAGVRPEIPVTPVVDKDALGRFVALTNAQKATIKVGVEVAKDAQAQILRLRGQLEGIGDKLATLRINVSGDAAAEAKVIKLQARLLGLAQTVAKIKIGGDTTGINAAIAKERAALAALQLQASKLKLNADASKVIARLAQIDKLVFHLRNAMKDMKAEVDITAAQTKIKALIAEAKVLESDEATVVLKANIAQVTAAIAAVRAKINALTSQQADIRFHVDTKGLLTAQAAMLALAGDAAKLEKAVADAGAAAGGAGGGFRGLGFAAGFGWGWFRRLNAQLLLFGGILPGFLGRISVLHLGLQLVFEALAVLIPAFIALGAAAAAAAPTVRDMAVRLNDIHTVATALNLQMPGLSGAFADIEAAVKPNVYVLFGEALNTINSHTGLFKTLAQGAAQVLDRLGARAELALGGSGLTGLVSHGVSDLQGLGNTIGNVFGIFGNFLKVLPQYAEKLLLVLQNVTGALEAISASPIVQGIARVGLAFHGAAIYGGLLGTAIGLLGIPLGRVAVRLAGLGKDADTAAAQLGKNAGLAAKMKAGWQDLGNALPAIGLRVRGLGKDVEGAAGKLSRGERATNLLKGALSLLSKVPVWGWVALGAAALGTLVFALSQSRNAAQQWFSTVEANITSQTTFAGVLSATKNAVQFANAQLAKTPQLVTQGAASVKDFQGLIAQGNPLYASWADNVKNLNAQQATEHSRLAQLTGLFGSSGAALGALNAVGIKAGDIAGATAAQWAIDVAQLRAYKTALTDLAGFQGGQAAAAQNALTFANNEQVKAIQQVVQAEDQLLQVITSGESAFIGFQQSIVGTSARFVSPSGLAQAAKLAKGDLSGLNDQSLAFANTLYNISIPALQKTIDALQNQQASYTTLTTVTATGAGEILKYAGNNEAARAVVVSLINNALGPGTVSLKTLNSWVKQNSTSLAGFSADIAAATIQAASLATLLKNQVNLQFHQLLLSESGASGALKIYTSDLVNNRAQTAQGRNDRQILINDLMKTGLNAKDATALVDGLQTQINNMHGKTVDVGVHVSASGSVQIAGQNIPGALVQQILVRGMAEGGKVYGAGGPTDDRIPAMLSRGEYVVRAASVNKVGVGTLDRINKMASGGLADLPGAVGSRVADDAGLALSRDTVLAIKALKALASIGSGTSILAYANSFAGKAPYVWGGNTPAGWDCSGFVEWVYNHFGIGAPGRPTAASFQQWAKQSAPTPGGMVFFGNPAHHIGLVEQNTGMMISALGQAFGTIISSIGGNSGFGIPPRGFNAVNIPTGGGGFGGGNAYWIGIGREMAARSPYGWIGPEFDDLVALWNRESGWNPNARNPSSGAAGIPQDISGNFHGGGVGQIAWGLNYILNRYFDPAEAWAHELAQGWYAKGGIVHDILAARPKPKLAPYKVPKGLSRSGWFRAFGEQEFGERRAYHALADRFSWWTDPVSRNLQVHMMAAQAEEVKAAQAIMGHGPLPGPNARNLSAFRKAIGTEWRDAGTKTFSKSPLLARNLRWHLDALNALINTRVPDIPQRFHQVLPSPQPGHFIKAHEFGFDRGGTLAPGWNMAYNGTGRPEHLVPAGGNVTVEAHLHVHGPVGSRAELETWLLSSINHLAKSSQLTYALRRSPSAH